MRCYCCNRPLSTQEAVRRFKESLSFTEMCDNCLNTIDVDTVDGEGEPDDLEDVEEYEDDQH